MPRLSGWAETGVATRTTCCTAQTIRGLYAMLCGDYSKLDSGTPKGVEAKPEQPGSGPGVPCPPSCASLVSARTSCRGAGLRFPWPRTGHLAADGLSTRPLGR